jgi:hypothetical protein
MTVNRDNSEGRWIFPEYDDMDPRECIKELFKILERTEENDDGTRVFHPTTISSVRVHEGEKLRSLLKRMKSLVEEIPHYPV